MEAPCGFTRADGSRYDVNTPSYTELQEAFSLLTQVNSTRGAELRLSSELRNLTNSHKGRKAFSDIENLQQKINNCAESIKNSEKRIAELLGSDGDKGKEEE